LSYLEVFSSVGRSELQYGHFFNLIPLIDVICFLQFGHSFFLPDIGLPLPQHINNHLFSLVEKKKKSQPCPKMGKILKKINCLGESNYNIYGVLVFISQDTVFWLWHVSCIFLKIIITKITNQEDM